MATATTTTNAALVTTIDQHRGTHSTGLPIRALCEVRTSAADHGLEPGDPRLAEIHAAEVDLASLDAGHRARARAYLDDLAGFLTFGSDAVDYLAAAIREGIGATR